MTAHPAGSTGPALTEIGPDIWIVEGSVVCMDFGPIKAVPFPTRMTVIRLPGAQLFCHSPTELSPALARELAEAGTVRHLVSPNWMHYVHIPAWRHAHADATAWASPGVKDRMRKQGLDFRFDACLDAAAPAEWADEIDQMIFEGSPLLREVVFFHRRSRTLILTDLVQNHEPHHLSTLARLFAWFGGALAPDGKTPLDLRLSFLGHKRMLAQNLERLQGWRPERIVISHGRWFSSDGERQLERMFRWIRYMPF